MKTKLGITWILLVLGSTLLAQENYRPELFFREDWKVIPAEVPLSQKHVNNPELLLQLYGAGKDSLKKSNHERPVDDPFYVWSGLCLENWLIALKHRQYDVDLSGYAKIRWRTKQAGLRQLHIALKLANGNWIVSDLCSGASKDWQITEFNLQDARWFKLDIERIREMGPAVNADLSHVVEIGFTDLMPGGRSASCSRLDWIEVDGKPVTR